MYPPGGVWQVGDKAGDPILLATNPGRYKAFYLCNSVAFVASLFAILLGQKRYLRKHHALQAAMILNLLALIVAYAIGSCRDQISTMYVLGIAGAAVVYVVIHVQYFTLGATKDDDAATAVVDKRGRRFFLFAILVASITYQAGLTPPGGFLLQDGPAAGGGAHHHVGDPVLLYNYPRRYKAFFYCNSVSFMVSTVLLLLLVNPNMSRPAIRSHALSLCSAVSFVCLIGAFAAGSTQHLKTSIYIFVVTSVAVFLCLPLLLTIFSSYFLRDDAQPPTTEKAAPDHRSQKMVDLMTLGIIVGSVAYQAGLDPPGGSWQSGSAAGHPVMHDRRKGRYLAFLCGNSTSFISSIYLIEILLFTIYFPKSKGLDKAIEPMVVAQYLGFLVAYAAGSSRQWRVSAHVGTMVIAVLAYVATHVMLSFCIKKESPKPGENTPQQEDEADPDEADPSSSPPSA
jgi:hypothetical membrane protein